MTLFYIKYVFYYKYKEINNYKSKGITGLYYNLGQNNMCITKKMLYYP